VEGTFSTPPGSGSSQGGSGEPGASAPVSWLQIEQGWSVVASDGAAVGTVAQVEGDKNDDIFDGLAVASAEERHSTLYVPAEKVGPIVSGRVALTIAAADLAALEPFRAPPPETRWTPGRAPLAPRISNWLRRPR
jgi:hypothetical protein